MNPAASSFASSFLMASRLSGELLGHPWHIRWFPCEYISVGPKEVDELEFLFVAQPYADDGGLGRVPFLQLDGLRAHVIRRFDGGLAWLLRWY